MPITCKLPDKKHKEEYSVYISGNVIFKYTEEELGTLIRITGTGIAFYSSSNARRAIIFQELSEKSYDIPVIEGTIPYVKGKVRILYKAKGRKVDLLKFFVYNLEKEYNTLPYSLGINYWLTMASYIDSIIPSKRKTSSTKRQMKMITDKYIKREKRLNDYKQRYS